MTRLPKWTVLTNINSPESNEFIGTCREFFYDEGHASLCYQRHKALGNVPTIRPFHYGVDSKYLGACHRATADD